MYVNNFTFQRFSRSRRAASDVGRFQRPTRLRVPKMEDGRRHNFSSTAAVEKFRSDAIVMQCHSLDVRFIPTAFDNDSRPHPEERARSEASRRIANERHRARGHPSRRPHPSLTRKRGRVREGAPQDEARGQSPLVLFNQSSGSSFTIEAP